MRGRERAASVDTDTNEVVTIDDEPTAVFFSPSPSLPHPRLVLRHPRLGRGTPLPIKGRR